MRKATFTLGIALAALVLAAMALLRAPVRSADAQASGDRWRAVRNYPPLVFTSKAWLDCSISSTKQGRQVMTTVSGQGFSFDAPMRPIKDGKVELKKPGMHYQFNSFPTGPVHARFNGLGEGSITEMKAEVEVDVKRFQQPGGPGTDIHFHSADMASDAAYVEFTGVWERSSDHKPFPFRVLFGSVPSGEGRVTPADSRPTTNMAAKRVSLGTPRAAATVTTALYEAEDDVRRLR